MAVCKLLETVSFLISCAAALDISSHHYFLSPVSPLTRARSISAMISQVSCPNEKVVLNDARTLLKSVEVGRRSFGE